MMKAINGWLNINPSNITPKWINTFNIPTPAMIVNRPMIVYAVYVNILFICFYTTPIIHLSN